MISRKPRPHSSGHAGGVSAAAQSRPGEVPSVLAGSRAERGEAPFSPLTRVLSGVSEYSVFGSRSTGQPMRLLLAACALTLSVATATLAQGNEPFPDLEFAGEEGGTVRLSQLKGNVILLNVWATWCGPCKLELPIVQRMYDRYSDRNFVVLAINVDADRKRVQPFLKRYNISLPVYSAAPEDVAQMTAMGIPSTFILGPDRSLIDMAVGFSPEVEERWRRVIEKHLKAPK